MKGNKMSQKIVNEVSAEVNTFLNERNWSKYKEKGQYVGYGLLNPVFDRIFRTAPDRHSAMFVIAMSLGQFCDVKEYFKDKTLRDTLPKE